ncbi:MAG: hypothetical protein CTY15_01340 [Methylocystis sp.]|nr:MAG: hypothetical protein CTY15_01340 [Methylocystis sp.]
MFEIGTARAAFVCSLLLPAFLAQPVSAQQQNYRQYRESLQQEGWKPVTSYGLKTASGKPLYQFPELVCGPELCLAKWRDRQGAEKSLSVLRGKTADDYQLVSQ